MTDPERHDFGRLATEMQSENNAAIHQALATLGPTVERVGTGYRLAHGDVVLDFTRLREARGELSGELRAALAGQHLSISRFNASSATVRRQMAQLLGQRTNGHGVNWPHLLEQLCVSVLETEHAPASLVEIGRRPKRQQPPRILDPLMPECAPTLIFGPGGTGKSTLAAAIAVSLASGVEIVRGWQPRKAVVAIVDWEASEDEVNDRIAGIAAGVGIEPPGGIFYAPARRPLADQVEELARILDEHRVDVLIVDSLGLAAGNTREGGDAAETALRLFSALRILGRTSLLVDHVRGDDISSSEHAGSRPYGSVYKVNLARSVFELRREESPGPEGAQLVLLHRKTNDGPLLPPMGLQVVHEPSRIRIDRCEVTAPDLEPRALTVGQRLRRELQQGALETGVLAARLSISATNIRSAVHREKYLQRLPDGRIGLVL